MLVAESAGFVEVALVGRVDASRALDRFGEDGRDAVRVFRHQHRQCLDVVGRYLHHVIEQRPVALLVEWETLRAGSAVVGAVVATDARDDQAAFGLAVEDLGQPGQLHRRIDCL